MSEASMTEDKRSMQQFAGVAGNRHYNDLDGFRAIAAIAIVVMHVHVRGEYVHTSTWLSTAVEPLGTFVTLFFIHQQLRHVLRILRPCEKRFDGH